ncbi:(2Fe-2S)-binding protein [Gayadomonas joobiniege]|uniref:(2Fe-2S)-binding protein n=1 Tax=Gayadomonas joobiniege TaxID=1234606 RepID=UPI00037CB335|nr:(2Fe-2S)-binding protein [Gayadomonas joobiniege]
MAIYELSVNQRTHSVDVDPDMPVLWVLRDVLGLTGTKFGCGKGLCGACTVLFNGHAVRSCSLPVAAVQNGELITIEEVDKISQYQTQAIPIKQAWIEHKVPQCGYCQPGQIMSAVALLKNNDKLDRKQIIQQMSGNICRCGTYQRIEKAILSVAKGASDDE